MNKREQPLVFVSKYFFLEFAKRLQRSKPQDGIEERKRLIKLEELLFYKSTVYMNLSDEEFNYYTNPEFIANSEDDIVFKMYFDILSRQNKIMPISKELECFRQSDYPGFDQMLDKPNFVFLAEATSVCNIIGKEFGVICISKNIDFDPSLFEVVKKTVAHDSKVDLSRAGSLLKHLPFSHTIKIVDPYIFDDSWGVEYVIRLVQSLAATKVSIKLLVEFKNSKGKNIKVIEDALRKNIPNLKLSELIICNRTFIHNRNITTNTFWLSSDYGFRPKYGKDEANWMTYPLIKNYTAI